MVYLNDVDYRGQEKRNRAMLELYSRKNRNYDLELCILSSAPRIAWCLFRDRSFHNNDAISALRAVDFEGYQAFL